MYQIEKVGREYTLKQDGEVILARENLAMIFNTIYHYEADGNYFDSPDDAELEAAGIEELDFSHEDIN